MNIYLASRYPRRPELAVYRAELEAAGHTVVSRWIDGDDEPVEHPEGGYTEAAGRIARGDLDDLDRADVLISFTEEPKIVPYLEAAARGGRHVEFGYAVAQGKQLIVIGPWENVFHTLIEVGTFDRWGPQVLDALKREDGS